MRIRTLRESEREALLALLDGWELPDGWRGRDFFRRHLEDDPTYCDENVWVAEEDGQLVSCVQIFPRSIRTAGGAVPVGGIGSVFTGAQARGRGLASRVLERAADAMAARGMPLSLLFASRLSFYGRLGWISWPGSRTLLRPTEEGGRRAPIDARPFDASRDLPAVQQIHSSYSGRREGTTLRDAAAWEATLRNGGNPHEEFLLALREGEPVAYVRAAVLSGFLLLTELGRADDAAEPLAALVQRVLTPRDADPLSRPGRPSEALRALGVAPPLLDPPLAEALRGRGIGVETHPDPNSLLRVLDAPALAKAAGTRLAPGEDASSLLRRLLPPDRFSCWAADRF